MKARSNTPLNSAGTAIVAPNTNNIPMDNNSNNTAAAAVVNGSAASSAAQHKVDGGGGGAASTAEKRVHDLSLLRLPIGTSISGFSQVQRAYETGTDEIRYLLSRECDVIFECRVCRNIFRSLANFLTHKRVYCATRFNGQQHCHFRQLEQQQEEEDDSDWTRKVGTTSAFSARLESDCTQIVQLEQEFADARPTTVHASRGSLRDLGSVIERLRRRESANRAPIPVTRHPPNAMESMKQELIDVTMMTATTDANANNTGTIKSSDDICNVGTTATTTAAPSLVLQLDRIADSKAAVFQTLRTDIEPALLTSNIHAAPIECSKDSIKTDVLELHYLQQASSVVSLDEQGKAVPVLIGTESAKRIVCDICQMNFETEKTLRLHVKKNHVTSTFVYPCPSCSLTFMRPFALMQHLNVIHKKSNRRLRQMRETIQRRRTRISQIQVKGPSRELVRLQQSERAAAAAAASAGAQRISWPDNYNGIMSASMVGSMPATIGGTLTVGNAGGSNDATGGKHRSSMCAYCGKAFERRAALSTHLKTCTAKQAANSYGGGSGAGGCIGSAQINGGQMMEHDESNSNSTDSFMAMLQREKTMQARIHEQETVLLRRGAAASIVLTTPTVAGGSGNVGGALVAGVGGVDETMASVSAEVEARHRRKRVHARKSAPTELQRCGDMDFQWDDSNGSHVTVTAGSSAGNYLSSPANAADRKLGDKTMHPKFDLNAIDTAISSMTATMSSCDGSRTAATEPQTLAPLRIKRAKLLHSEASATAAAAATSMPGFTTTPATATTSSSLSSSTAATLATASSLSQMTNNTDIEQRPTDCTICDKKFANLSNLRRHVAMFHYREKRFACKLCVFRAYRKVDVLNHVTSAHPTVRTAARRCSGGGSGGGFEYSDAQSADILSDSELVELIEVDKNKYTVERGLAVAAAVERMNERDHLEVEDSGSSGSSVIALLDRLVEDPNGDDSRSEIIIPVLHKDELDEIDFELIPMEEFTAVGSAAGSAAISFDSNVRSSKTSSPLHATETILPSGPLLAAPSTLNNLPPKLQNVNKRQRGRPKGSGKTQLASIRPAAQAKSLHKQLSKRKLNDSNNADDTTGSSSSIAALETSTTESMLQAAAAAVQAATSPPLPPPPPLQPLSSGSGAGGKLVRHASSNSSSSEETPATAATAGRRPIRNRVKLANKDFVYDLSSLLKKETEVRHYAPIIGRSQQKRKALASAATAASVAAATAAAVTTTPSYPSPSPLATAAAVVATPTATPAAPHVAAAAAAALSTSSDNLLLLHSPVASISNGNAHRSTSLPPTPTKRVLASVGGDPPPLSLLRQPPPAAAAAAAAATVVVAVPIYGAAMAMAQLAVTQQRASFNRPPVMPTAHAIEPAKIALRRSVGTDWRVVETAVKLTTASTATDVATSDSEIVSMQSIVSNISTASSASSASSTPAASSLSNPSKEQLLDMLTVRRRDTIMDKYHTVAKQTQRRLQKTLNATATAAATTMEKVRKRAALAAVAANTAMHPAEEDTAPLSPPKDTGSPTTAQHQQSTSTSNNSILSGPYRDVLCETNGTAIMPATPTDGSRSNSSSDSAVLSPSAQSLPLTPSKQRLTAIERLAEIKLRKQLPETMRKLNISDDALSTASSSSSAGSAAAVTDSSNMAAATIEFGRH